MSAFRGFRLAVAVLLPAALLVPPFADADGWTTSPPELRRAREIQLVLR